MLSKSRMLFKAIVLVVFISACETSNDLMRSDDPIDLNLSMQLSSDTIDSFEVSAAYLMVHEFRFEGETPHDNRVKIEVKDDHGFKADLISGIFNPRLTFTIPKGPYEEVKLRIESEPTKKNPSLAIEGDLKLNSGQLIPVRFELNDDLRFRLEIKQENNPFFFEDHFLDFFLLHVDLIKGFQNIDYNLWTTAEIEEGAIVINASNNTKLFQHIADKIRTEVRIKIER